MSLLHNAYTALRVGFTYQIENEIFWNDEYGNPITIEPINMGREIYKIRGYYDNGSLDYEKDYCKKQLHGKHHSWYKSGQKHFENSYFQGQHHGECMSWREDGLLLSVTYYIYGQKVTPGEWYNYNDATT